MSQWYRSRQWSDGTCRSTTGFKLPAAAKQMSTRLGTSTRGGMGSPAHPTKPGSHGVLRFFHRWDRAAGYASPMAIDKCGEPSSDYDGPQYPSCTNQAPAW